MTTLSKLPIGTCSEADLNLFDPCSPGHGMQLDVGIRRYVLVLRSQSVETCESCEGGEGHAYTEPTIKFCGNAYAGYHAFASAMNYGLPVIAIRRTWDVCEGQLVGPNWEMVFSRKDSSKGDKTP